MNTNVYASKFETSSSVNPTEGNASAHLRSATKTSTSNSNDLNALSSLESPTISAASISNNSFASNSLERPTISHVSDSNGASTLEERDTMSTESDMEDIPVEVTPRETRVQFRTPLETTISAASISNNSFASNSSESPTISHVSDSNSATTSSSSKSRRTLSGSSWNSVRSSTSHCTTPVRIHATAYIRRRPYDASASGHLEERDTMSTESYMEAAPVEVSPRETRVQFKTPLETIHLYDPELDLIENCELILKLDSEEGHGPSKLLEDAVNIVTQNWVSSRSLMTANYNTDELTWAKEGFQAALEKLSVTVLDSDDESHSEFQGLEEVTLCKGVDIKLHGSQGRTLGDYLDYVLEATSYGSSRRSFLNIALLLSVIVLRNGDTASINEDFIEIYGNPETERSPSRSFDLGRSVPPLPRKAFARFSPKEDTLFQSFSTSIESCHICVTKQLARPLTNRSFFFREGSWWRLRNGFAAVFSSKWDSKEWATAIYGLVLASQLRPQPDTPVSSSRSEVSRVRRMNTAYREKQRDMDFEFEFQEVVSNWYALLAFAPRGAYRVGRVILYIEHGVDEWFSYGSRLPASIGKLEPFARDVSMDSNPYDSKSSGLLLISFCEALTRDHRNQKKSYFASFSGPPEAPSIKRSGYEMVRGRWFAYPRYISVQSILNSLRGYSFTRLKHVIAHRLRSAPELYWHAMEARPNNFVELKYGQFKRVESSGSPCENYDHEGESNDRESLVHFYDEIQNEMPLTQRIRHAQFKIGQIGYHVEGGRVRLHPVKTFLWQSYVICSAIGSVLVGIINPAKRENWYERLFDGVQTLTFLWVGVFGLLKLTNEDQNIIRHTIFGEKIIREEEDVRTAVGDINTCKLALINCAQTSLSWLSAEDLRFANPKCTGSVRIFGGLVASDAIKEGLLITENVAIYLKLGKGFRVSNGHIDKRKELTAEELADALKPNTIYDGDFNVAGTHSR
ncbi:peptidoglycan-binding protein [Gracilaria domingensis]|nr:peptidoglycan-binding protein [Gracilaria domingensis]